LWLIAVDPHRGGSISLRPNVAQMYHRLGAAIREDRDAQPDFDLAVKRHRLLDAIQRSSDQGTRVQVS